MFGGSGCKNMSVEDVSIKEEHEQLIIKNEILDINEDFRQQMLHSQSQSQSIIKIKNEERFEEHTMNTTNTYHGHSQHQQTYPELVFIKEEVLEEEHHHPNHNEHDHDHKRLQLEQQLHTELMVNEEHEQKLELEHENESFEYTHIVNLQQQQQAQTHPTKENAIECRSSLWDTSSNDYCNRDLKKKRWEEVANIFGGEEMTAEEKKQLGLQLQKRWKGIRSCYTREMNRQKSKKSESGGERKSEYIYFKQLQFLQKAVSVKDTADEIDGTVDNNGDNSIPDRSQIKSKKRNKDAASASGEDALVTALNKSIETRERRENNEDDEDRLFLLSLLSTLRDVPRERKISTKIRLMSVLEEAVQGNMFSSPISDLQSYINVQGGPNKIRPTNVKHK